MITGVDRDDNCLWTVLVITALMSAMPMKIVLKTEAVIKKLMDRMTTLRTTTRKKNPRPVRPVPKG